VSSKSLVIRISSKDPDNSGGTSTTFHPVWRSDFLSMTTPTGLKPFNIRDFYRNLRGVSIVAPWVVHLFATDIVLSALLPFSFVFPSFIYNVSSELASLVWRGVQTIFTRFNRARITTSGDQLPKNESAIVVANHVSWADFYLVQHLALKCGMLGRCRWFAKQQLKWVPFLGWGLWAMGMPMISRRWDKDQQELDRVFRGPKSYRWPICQWDTNVPQGVGC
jgi:1-acyl-sn-glycerol-3-phosphate acyltransferase